jgi:hypothetical protein
VEADSSAHSGSAAAKIVKASDYPNVSQTVSVLASTNYRLSIYAKNGGSGSVKITVYDLTHWPDILIDEISSLSTSYGAIVHDFVTPSGTTQLIISIDAGYVSGTIYLDDVSLKQYGVPTATPTNTPTATFTPTATRTPTATPTAWPAGAFVCPTAAVTVDGSLSDWASIPATPVLLSAANAAYIWPAATPSTSDLSASFQCAHSADALLISGIITDSVRYADSAPIDDDAVQIGVDGWGDGFLRLGADDHEVLVASDGRLRDFASLQITATTAISTTVGGWQFELRIPQATLELQSLFGRVINLVYGLIDDDDGGDADQVMTAPTVSPGLPYR